MSREVGTIIFLAGFAFFMLVVILYQDLEGWSGIFEVFGRWFDGWNKCPDTGGCAEVER